MVWKLGTVNIVIALVTAASAQPASGQVVFSSVAALRANIVPWATGHLQGYANPGDGGGGDVEHVPSDTTSADNGCTIYRDAASHRYYRTNLQTAMPVEDCGVLVTNARSANTTPMQNAITYGPWQLLMQRAGTYDLTGFVMNPAHELVGAGDGGSAISTLNCTGIAYVHASQLTGALISTSPVCFQNGDTAGTKFVLRDMNITTADLTSTGAEIAVGSGDSTTDGDLAEGFTCYDSKIAGYVAVYWGNSNGNVVNNCIFEGGSGTAPAAEMYESANVRGLKGAVQSVEHIGGFIFMSQTSTGSAVYQVDAGANGIFSSDYRLTRITNAATCFTLAGGPQGAQTFENVGIEDCGTILREGRNVSIWSDPNVTGTNNAGQLISGLGVASLAKMTISSYGPAQNLITSGTIVRMFVGSGSPNGAVTAIEIGDVYFRSGSGATVANSTCKASAANNSSWYEVSSPTTLC